MLRYRVSRPGTESKRHFRLLAGAGLVSLLAGCGGGGASATAVVEVITEVTPEATSKPFRAPTPSPTPVPTPTSTFAGFLGVNVSANNYHGGDRAFMNLLVASGWQDSTKSGWPSLPATQVDRNGDLLSLAVGQHAVRIITPPAASWSGVGVTVRCAWVGSATVRIAGARAAGTDVYGAHAVQFFMPTLANNLLTWLDVTAMSTADPLRKLDRREVDADRQALFAPEFLAALKPFGIIRFLDWDDANNNPQNPQWAGRTPENGLNQGVVAWENMVALARTVDADA